MLPAVGCPEDPHRVERIGPALSGPGARVGGHYSRGAIFIVSNLAATQGYTSLADASSAIRVGEGLMSALGPAGRLGDLNGDGIDDLVVGGEGGDERYRRAYVFLGPLSGTIHVADADLVLESRRDYTSFGTFVDGAGDVDGDGIPDLMIGGQGSWGGRAGAGALFLFSGADLLSAM